MSSGGLFYSGILLPLCHGGFSGIRSCLKDWPGVGWWPVGKRIEPGGCWSFGETLLQITWGSGLRAPCGDMNSRTLPARPAQWPGSLCSQEESLSKPQVLQPCSWEADVSVWSLGTRRQGARTSCAQGAGEDGRWLLGTGMGPLPTFLPCQTPTPEKP